MFDSIIAHDVTTVEEGFEGVVSRIASVDSYSSIIAQMMASRRKPAPTTVLRETVLDQDDVTSDF